MGDREDGVTQKSKRETCQWSDSPEETTCASRSNWIFVLESVEYELMIDEEREVVVLQEIVEITVDSGDATSVWPIQKKRVTRTKATKTVRMAAVSGSPIRIEGDARLEFVRDGKMCNMTFVDTAARRPLTSVSAMSTKGNVVGFGQQDSHIENTSTGQRIPKNRRNAVLVMQLKAQTSVDSTKMVGFEDSNTNSVFWRPARTQTWRNFVNIYAWGVGVAGGA